jgi:glycine betaine/proline transport system substrate-binding protein
MKFVTSSTPAMLAELKSATGKDENIAVTLWRPQWAYAAFPIKDLTDPKDTLGTAESIHSLASTSFSADYPKLAGRIKDFTLSRPRCWSRLRTTCTTSTDRSTTPRRSSRSGSRRTSPTWTA